MRFSRLPTLMVAATAVTIGLTSGTCQAGFINRTLGYQYQFPNYNTSAPYIQGNNFVVGAGVERQDVQATSAGNGSDFASLDVSDTQVAAIYYASATWSTQPYNGFRLYDVNNTVSAITSVTIDPSTNMVGFNASRVSFDADNINVNWQGLTFNQSTVVRLNVTFADTPVGVVSTPVPPTALAAVVGLLGMVGVRLRRRTA